MTYSKAFWAQEERLDRISNDPRIPGDRPEGEHLAWDMMLLLWENIGPETRRQFRVYIGPRRLDLDDGPME